LCQVADDLRIIDGIKFEKRRIMRRDRVQESKRGVAVTIVIAGLPTVEANSSTPPRFGATSAPAGCGTNISGAKAIAPTRDNRRPKVIGKPKPNVTLQEIRP
jgi:hypothetical protein